MIRRFARINSVPHYRVENMGVAQYSINSHSSPENDDTAAQPTPPPVFIHPHPEYQYLNLIQDILEQKNEHIGRNGSTLSIFGAGIRRPRPYLRSSMATFQCRIQWTRDGLYGERCRPIGRDYSVLERPRREIFASIDYVGMEPLSIGRDGTSTVPCIVSIQCRQPE